MSTILLTLLKPTDSIFFLSHSGDSPTFAFLIIRAVYREHSDLSLISTEIVFRLSFIVIRLFFSLFAIED